MNPHVAFFLTYFGIICGLNAVRPASYGHGTRFAFTLFSAVFIALVVAFA